ncbi:hypothetical protein Acr_00g0047990 [Actinidia rufa]|uniref:Uncharacterized protein n=1 Tax=Actinidia rufa TaxID=165716 RepID=A0A7J0DJX5_9ERIC|nr:hypothetical protein Acr_00g0047990 [Actinidia rufa]
MDDEGRKRRLPSWMTGVAAADQATKSEKENKSVNNNNVEQGIAPKSLCPKSKSKTGIKHIEKGVSLLEEELSEANSCALVKCGTERQRENINQEEDAGSDFENLETAAEQKRSNRGGRKVRKCALRKQRKAESSRSKSSEEIEAPSPGENDGELTVDDLMSIAHEYIRTDEHKEQQQSSHRKQEAERQLPAISLSGNESGGLPNAPQNNRRSPKHNEIVSFHNSTGNSTGVVTVVNQCRTGDPAHDMLDLFLGPLLKKPPGEEHKIEFIEEDMSFACEIKKQRQNNIATDEVVPLTKKKRSLKDKVAMFLD